MHVLQARVPGKSHLLQVLVVHTTLKLVTLTDMGIAHIQRQHHRQAHHQMHAQLQNALHNQSQSFEG